MFQEQCCVTSQPKSERGENIRFMIYSGNSSWFLTVACKRGGWASGLGHPCHPLQLPLESVDAGLLLGAGLGDSEEGCELLTESLAERTFRSQAQVSAAEAALDLKHIVSVYRIQQARVVIGNSTRRDLLLRNTERLVSVGPFQGRQEMYPWAISRPLGWDLRDIVYMREPFSGPARDILVGPHPD